MSDSAVTPLEKIEALIATDPRLAVQQLRDLLIADPFNAAGYRLLSRGLDEVEARSDRGVRTRLRGTDTALDRAAAALAANDFATAGHILRDRLLERPTDGDALCLVAELAYELHRERQAEDLLRLAVEFDPGSTYARIQLARLLDREQRPLEARQELEPVLAREPDNLFAKAVYAAALGRTGQYDEAAALYEELLRKIPDEPSLWSTYGYILQTMGRTDEAVRAMRRATQLAPNNGEAWWTLANVKTHSFDAADVAAMRAALGRNGLGDYDRLHIHFALGKAYEDAGDAAEAFGHYDRANTIRRRSAPYDPQAIAAEVDASIATFSRAFFEQRTGWGAEANDPIFIVGMPRAGSTLIEQILASHPQVEGTKELLDIPMIAKELGHGRSAYFKTLSQLDRDRARSLGEQYLERTRVQRATGRPFFVDKLPTNWLHVPLIHLLLPNAKIVDARRHPLACGFSNFKQNYTRGQSFSYDLASIGHYYGQYVRMMAHIDDALPGRVHRVFHEQLVDDSEREVRRLLDYLELPFDPACLRFHETDRAVRTPSAGQVRRPIDPQSVDRWRMFEPWLDPLKRALGPVLDAYPDVPAASST